MAAEDSTTVSPEELAALQEQQRIAEQQQLAAQQYQAQQDAAAQQAAAEADAQYAWGHRNDPISTASYSMPPITTPEFDWANGGSGWAAGVNRAIGGAFNDLGRGIHGALDWISSDGSTPLDGSQGYGDGHLGDVLGSITSPTYVANGSTPPSGPSAAPAADGATHDRSVDLAVAAGNGDAAALKALQDLGLIPKTPPGSPTHPSGNGGLTPEQLAALNGIRNGTIGGSGGGSRTGISTAMNDYQRALLEFDKQKQADLNAHNAAVLEMDKKKFEAQAAEQARQRQIQESTAIDTSNKDYRAYQAGHYYGGMYGPGWFAPGGGAQPFRAPEPFLVSEYFKNHPGEVDPWQQASPYAGYTGQAFVNAQHPGIDPVNAPFGSPGAGAPSGTPSGATPPPAGAPATTPPSSTPAPTGPAPVGSTPNPGSLSTHDDHNPQGQGDYSWMWLDKAHPNQGFHFGQPPAGVDWSWASTPANLQKQEQAGGQGGPWAGGSVDPNAWLGSNAINVNVPGYGTAAATPPFHAGASGPDPQSSTPSLQFGVGRNVVGIPIGQQAGQGSLPAFADGGEVPGATGEPVLAVVHAGETIRNPMQESALQQGVNMPLPAVPGQTHFSGGGLVVGGGGWNAPNHGKSFGDYGYMPVYQPPVQQYTAPQPAWTPPATQIAPPQVPVFQHGVGINYGNNPRPAGEGSTVPAPFMPPKPIDPVVPMSHPQMPAPPQMPVQIPTQSTLSNTPIAPSFQHGLGVDFQHGAGGVPQLQVGPPVMTPQQPPPFQHGVGGPTATPVTSPPVASNLPVVNGPGHTGTGINPYWGNTPLPAGAVGRDRFGNPAFSLTGAGSIYDNLGNLANPNTANPSTQQALPGAYDPNRQVTGSGYWNDHPIPPHANVTHDSAGNITHLYDNDTGQVWDGNGKLLGTVGNNSGGQGQTNNPGPVVPSQVAPPGTHVGENTPVTPPAANTPGVNAPPAPVGSTGGGTGGTGGGGAGAGGSTPPPYTPTGAYTVGGETGATNHVPYGPELTGLGGFGALITQGGTPVAASMWQRNHLDPTSIAHYNSYLGDIAGFNPQDFLHYSQQETGSGAINNLPAPTKFGIDNVNSTGV